MSIMSEIKRRYYNESVSKIAEDLGLKYHQVTHKAYSMGLKKNKNMTKGRVFETAQRCESFTGFREDEPACYQFALRSGWIPEIKDLFGAVDDRYHQYEDGLIIAMRFRGDKYQDIADRLSALNAQLGRPARSKGAVYQRYCKIIDRPIEQIYP